MWALSFILLCESPDKSGLMGGIPAMYNSAPYILFLDTSNPGTSTRLSLHCQVLGRTEDKLSRSLTIRRIQILLSSACRAFTSLLFNRLWTLFNNHPLVRLQLLASTSTHIPSSTPSMRFWCYRGASPDDKRDADVTLREAMERFSDELRSAKVEDLVSMWASMILRVGCHSDVEQ